MKKYIFFFFISAISFAQVNTEVHLFDLKNDNGKWTISNGKNISNNKGYDSQPSFYDDTTILFSSNNKKQNDIAKYKIKTGKKNFINFTPKGSEYSPERIPSSKFISAVRLDESGLQRFYKYNPKTGKNSILLKDLVVAYPRWYNKNTLLAVSIVNDSLSLYITDVKSDKSTLAAKNVGRSVHKIPNSELVSFISKENKKWEVKSLDLKTKETKTIIQTNNKEDVCWLPDGTLLLAYKNLILKFNSKTDKNWSIFHRFTNENINNISRIIVNESGKKMVLVAEVSPRALAEEQLIAYNKRDIEAFLKPYADNVKVYTYPDKLDYEGIENMRKRYTPMFEKTKDLHCKITSRIVKGNIVIDEELVTANGQQFKAVAIYEILNGKIASVRFVR